jgi:hypothetical protein
MDFGLTTFLNARSIASGLSSTPTSRAISRNRLCCCGSVLARWCGALRVILIIAPFVIGFSHSAEAVIYKHVSTAKVEGLSADSIIINNPSHEMKMLQAFFEGLNKRNQFVSVRGKPPSAAFIECHVPNQIFPLEIIRIRQIPGEKEIQNHVAFFDDGFAIADVFNAKFDRNTWLVEQPAHKFDIETRPVRGSELLAANPPHESREYPKPPGHDNQRDRGPDHPPVWARIPLALLLGFGANGVLILGLLKLDNQRCFWGAALCGGALLMFFGGIGLALSLGFPATWGWWV